MIHDQFPLDIHEEIIIDNFAGGGGASTGIEMAHHSDRGSQYFSILYSERHPKAELHPSEGSRGRQL